MNMKSGAAAAITAICAAGILLIRLLAVDPTPEQLLPYGELRIGVDGSYPPYSLFSGGELQGMEIDLGRAVAEQIGMPVRFMPLGFDGLYDALLTDRVDLLLAALAPDPARTDVIAYTDPYLTNGLILVSSDNISSMQDMAGLSLAVEYGSEAHAEAARWLRRIAHFETLTYRNEAAALDAARLGLADAALVDALSSRLYFREHAGWDAQAAFVTRQPVVGALRHDRGALVRLINRALADLDAQGMLEQIRARWL
ncbi:amino acid ABC transporter substrate-binding protein [Anaerolineae bacterium CFX9]|nr:amino acid ABC transporter substrate-binding protein [Anaerolineae bacterium CFX9]